MDPDFRQDDNFDASAKNALLIELICLSIIKQKRVIDNTT